MLGFPPELLRTLRCFLFLRADRIDAPSWHGVLENIGHGTLERDDLGYKTHLSQELAVAAFEWESKLGLVLSGKVTDEAELVVIPGGY